MLLFKAPYNDYIQQGYFCDRDALSGAVTGERKEDNMEKESFLVLRNVIRAVIRWQLTHVFIDCHVARGAVPLPAETHCTENTKIHQNMSLMEIMSE